MTSPGEDRPQLLTVGHGTASAEQLLGTLTGAGVTALVDVRRFPGSRRHPQHAREALAAGLPTAGVEYRWEPRLGGRRAVSRQAEPVDTWWTVEAFRAYAAHTRTAEFAEALGEVLTQARTQVVAVLCSETVWWRCHRRLIADVAVLGHGMDVLHLLPPAAPRPHQVSAGARLTADGGLVWDGPRQDG